MESNEEFQPVRGIREGLPVEREGHRPPLEIEVDGRLVSIQESHPTGRAVREAAEAIPADQFVLIQIVGRKTRSVALDERIDLPEVERPRFRLFRDDRVFTFTLDGRGFEWGSDSIPAAELRAYAEIPPDSELVLGHEAGVVIPEDSQIALSKSHIALRLFTRRRQPELITIVINGRARQVKGPKISFSEVVALAFPNPPQGTEVQFTVQYERGPDHKPSGTLIEGQSVKIKNGMEFDVTPTNRS